MEVEVCREASTLHFYGHTELDHENTSLNNLLCYSEHATLAYVAYHVVQNTLR
jgi:hypothetical protein